MDLFKKYGLIALIGTGVFAALIFYSLNVPRNREANLIERGTMTVIVPILKPAARLSGFFEDAWDGYINLVNVHRENLKLRDEIKELNARVVAGNEAQKSNQRLEFLLEMKNTVKAPTLSASVVGEDVSSWFRTLIIDRGSTSGIR